MCKSALKVFKTGFIIIAISWFGKPSVLFWSWGRSQIGHNARLKNEKQSMVIHRKKFKKTAPIYTWGNRLFGSRLIANLPKLSSFILWEAHLEINANLGFEACNLFDGEVELDESYFGGVRKGKRGRGAGGKTAVLGRLKQHGKVFVVVIKDARCPYSQ